MHLNCLWGKKVYHDVDGSKAHTYVEHCRKTSSSERLSSMVRITYVQHKLFVCCNPYNLPMPGKPLPKKFSLSNTW